MATPNLGLTNTYISGDAYPHGQANSVADALDEAQGAIRTATITVAAEAANVKAVTVQVKNLAGVNLAEKAAFDAWLVDTNDATAALATTAPSGGWVAGTGRLHRTYTANKDARWLTTAAGACRIDITEASAKSFYLIVDVGGKLVVSPIITFA